MNQGMGPGHGPQMPSARPGQMTAVMRAMQQSTGPKVLRIGLVAGGRNPRGAPRLSLPPGLAVLQRITGWK